jgi:hypothetical protein
MKHSTKFQVSTTSHLGGEESTSYFKSSTPLGSTITQRKIIGSSCPDNMHMKHCTKFQVSMINHLRGEVSTSYFKSPTLLDPPQLKEKLLDPPVLTICTFTNDNEALYKVSSLYHQPSQRRSEHKLFQTLHPSLIHHNSKKNYWILLS